MAQSDKGWQDQKLHIHPPALKCTFFRPLSNIIPSATYVIYEGCTKFSCLYKDYAVLTDFAR